MRRSLLAAAALAALSGLSVGAASPAVAAGDELAIGHVEPGADGTVQVLVSLPVGAATDADSLTLSIGDTVLDSSAEPAGDAGEQIKRTTVIAFDTSNSMRTDGRIDAAKEAASIFLDNVPDDVYVGIVTFDSEVESVLPPSQDREAAQEAIAGLELSEKTRLNDGVIEAVEQAGTEGQRRILVLSDGKDTSRTPESQVTAAIREAEVAVDVVALDQAGDSLAPLQQMSEAGNGAVIPADAAALNKAFSDEAQALASQLLVTATVPDTVVGNEATVTVTAEIGGSLASANAYAVIRAAEVDGPDLTSSSKKPLVDVSRPVMLGGLAAVGVGLLLLLSGLLVPAKAAPATAEDRISAYGAGGAHAASHRSSEPAPALDQAKNAAAKVLHKNRGLEQKILHRLEAAGSALKPAEWLLMHGAIVFAGGVAGLLFFGGNILFILLGMLAGWLLPKFYLRRREKKRLKAFGQGLADTLQLMSGSLSAGLSLAQSVDTVVREGTEPISGEFKRVLIETRLGVPLEDALEGVGERMGSKDFEWVVMAIRIQREVGGNLAELLNAVAATLRERQYLRRQVQTLAAEGKLSGYILGGLPPGMVLYLLMVRRDYIMPMFTEPLGWAMLAGAAALLGMGAFLMSRIVKVEV